jgi:rhomboid protease GluP
MAEPRVHTWVTYALIAANVAMFGVELAAGVHATSPTPASMVEVGANFPPLTMSGEWWRLGSSMFLHFGLLHIALNMVCLWQGRVVETLFGRAAFIVIYLLAGVAGGVATLVLNPQVVSAGASGAVFGVYGGFGAYLWLRKSSMPEAVWRTTVRGIGMFVAINFAFGLFAPNISMTAHVGGLIVGFLVGAAMLYRSSEKPRVVRTLAVAVVGAGLAVGVALAAPRPAGNADWLSSFGSVETEVLAKLESIEARHRSGALTDPQAAGELERDVLKPWSGACRSLATVEPTARLRPLAAAARDYCGAREESWQTYVEGLRATGETKQGLLERHKFMEVALRGTAKAVTEAVRALEAE